VGLALLIDGTGYALALLPREPGDLALRTWTLSKLGSAGDAYQVSELPHSEGRWCCTCADWHFRHEGRGGVCKHVAAIRLLVDRGLLAPLPLVLATDPEGDLIGEDLDERWGLAPSPVFAAGAASVAGGP
jgi:hypothetical protein